MANHTHGPWVVTSPPNDSRVYDVFAPDGRLMHRGYWGGKADADLIAAAPDLLAALTELWLVTDVNDYNEAAYTAAQSAIAKAEGTDGR